MNQTRSYIQSPSLSITLAKLADSLAAGNDRLLIGPQGCGLSTASAILSDMLEQAGHPVIWADCRKAGNWEEMFKDASEEAAKVLEERGARPILLVDHVDEFEVNQTKDLCRVVSGDGKSNFHSRVWVGTLDYRSDMIEAAIPILRDPKSFVLLPEYPRDDLLRIYFAIGGVSECEWGEAMLYFIHDWCNSDVSLVDGMTNFFYGNWREGVYDDAVMDSLTRWLKSDEIVDLYRKTVHEASGSAREVLRLLCAGGKIPCNSNSIDHETDSTLRNLYLSGIVRPNLIPGFYQFRNTTVKLLALQEIAGASTLPDELLRQSSNARVTAILQDSELTLRQLASNCFSAMGYDAVKARLMKTKTDALPMAPELRSSLTEWANSRGGEELQKEMKKFLSDYTGEFLKANNLWSRVCILCGEEMDGVGAAPQEPTEERIADFLTFGELSDQVLALCSERFPSWTAETPGQLPPSKTWPAHLARLRRLRNRAAHLRNITFQDMEDLLTSAREMRRDIHTYAK